MPAAWDSNPPRIISRCSPVLRQDVTKTKEAREGIAPLPGFFPFLPGPAPGPGKKGCPKSVGAGGPRTIPPPRGAREVEVPSVSADEDLHRDEWEREVELSHGPTSFHFARPFTRACPR